MDASSKEKTIKAQWILIAMLLILLVSVLVFNSILKPEPILSDAQKNRVTQISAELSELEHKWDTEITGLNETRSRLLANSESDRLTGLLISTFEDFKSNITELQLELDLVIDSTGINYAEKELNDLKKAWEGGKKLLSEHRKLLGTFSLMGAYEQRIDSLKTLLKNEQLAKRLNDPEKQKLQNEIKNYEQRLEQLKVQGIAAQQQNDSLTNVNKKQSALIDSLTNALERQVKAYEDLVEQARNNASFANKLSLWYYEKDNTKKPRRRQLTNDENDYNKASEIKTINGQFTISASIYVPYEIATVYLKANNGAETIAEAKVGVRNQESGEFVLIPPDKLSEGKYTVTVEYTGKTILSEAFYVQ